jgi:putative sigma-54 modulation protein
MKVTINAVHFKTDKKLEDYIQEKVSKLSSVYDGAISSEVTLKIDKNDKIGSKIAEIKVLIPGNDLYAKKQSKTFEEATETAVNALKKQLSKHKEKIKGI